MSSLLSTHPRDAPHNQDMLGSYWSSDGAYDAYRGVLQLYHVHESQRKG